MDMSHGCNDSGPELKVVGGGLLGTQRCLTFKLLDGCH